MVWFIPIGIYEGLKATTEITDSTVDLSGDAPDLKHVALRIGTGTIPVPDDYDVVLRFLAAEAPSDVYLPEWVAQTDDPDGIAKLFEELVDIGMVMSFGEFPLDDARMAGRAAVKMGSISRVRGTADAGNRSIWVDAGRGEVLAHNAFVEIVEGLSGPATPVSTLFERFATNLPPDDFSHAQQIFESDLQSFVQTGALSVMMSE